MNLEERLSNLEKGYKQLCEVHDKNKHAHLFWNPIALKSELSGLGGGNWNLASCGFIAYGLNTGVTPSCNPIYQASKSDPG